MSGYLIEKRGLYYRQYARGYTGLKSEAGRYSFEEAKSRTYPNGPFGSRDGMKIWPEEHAPEYAPNCPLELRKQNEENDMDDKLRTLREDRDYYKKRLKDTEDKIARAVRNNDEFKRGRLKALRDWFKSRGFDCVTYEDTNRKKLWLKVSTKDGAVIKMHSHDDGATLTLLYELAGV